MKKVIFFNSHPIQYFAPLYKKMTQEGVDVEVWYGSDESIKGSIDQQFGVKVKWNIPLLKGYSYRFFKNYSWKPSIYNGFFGLINIGILAALWKTPKSLVIVHGWGYLINVLILIAAKIAGHTVGIRSETPLNQELLKSKKILFFKRLVFKSFLFRWIDTFFYIGLQNKEFYQYHGIKEEQLIFCPYAVDNLRFQQAANQLLPIKKDLREEMMLSPSTKIILFSGKYIHKKRPMDLLHVYAKLKMSNVALIMVGEGELRPQMEAFIAEKKMENVFLTGFINQNEISKYYAVADVFVMCSGVGETWGLVVNEALNFKLPIVVSDIPGCAYDLIEDGIGFTYSIGNKDELFRSLKKTLEENYSINENAFQNKTDIYSYDTIIDKLNDYLASKAQIKNP